MNKLKAKFYEYLLKRFKNSIKRNQLKGEDKILFLARELTKELENQGYNLSTSSFEISYDISEFEGKLEVYNIINHWRIREEK